MPELLDLFIELKYAEGQPRDDNGRFSFSDGSSDINMSELTIGGSSVGYISPWAETEGYKVQARIAGMKTVAERTESRNQRADKKWKDTLLNIGALNERYEVLVRENDKANKEIQARIAAYPEMSLEHYSAWARGFEELNKEQSDLWDRNGKAEAVIEAEREKLWADSNRLSPISMMSMVEATRDPAAWALLTKEKGIDPTHIYSDSAYGREEKKMFGVWDAGIRDALALVSDKGIMTLPQPRFTTGNGYDGRACFYPDENKIVAPPGTDRYTISHEVGHSIEHNAGYIDRVGRFLDRRTEGAKVSNARSLNSLTGSTGYRAGEVAHPDRFPSPYTGKEYRATSKEPRSSSEVLSMGIQYMTHDPVHFARTDPDYFTFIYNTLKGITDGDSPKSAGGR